MRGAHFSLLRALRLTIRRAHLPTTAVFKCLTIFLCIGEGRLAAQTGFSGQTVSVDYEWPQIGTALYTTPSAPISAAGTTFTLPAQQTGATALIAGATIVISYQTGWNFNTTNPKTFDGWVITDLAANITGVSLAGTNISGFIASQLSFDNHHVYVNQLGYASLAAGASITVSVQFGQTAATGACIAAPSGLVSWWPGDTNENDIIGGHNPTVVSAVSIVPGKVLNGFRFGTEGYIDIPTAPSLQNQQFTWLAWVRPDGPGPNASNIFINNDIDGTHASISMAWRSADQRFTFHSGSNTTDLVVSNAASPAGIFYLVAATYDGTTFRLFVNGTLQGTLAETKTITYPANNWEIGSGTPNGFPNFPDTWNGVIDEVQGFNRALSATELLSIFNAGSAGECKPASVASGGIVSASAFGGFTSISPGSWVEIYGSNLASDARSWASADFNGINAPTSLDGTTVTIGGEAAFIDYISPGQVNALVASNIPTGPQQLTVTTAAGTSTAIAVTVNATEPGLLAPASFTINGTPYAAAFFSDGTSVLPTGAITGVTSRPAKPGDTIILYGVGFGPVSPSIPAGQLVQQSNMLASSFQMLIGGVPATVAYAGLAPSFTGLYQFDITVPSVATGAQPLTFTLGGNPGAQTLNIAVGN